MQLSSKQKKELKGMAHKLPAYVTIGKSGMSTPVLREIHRSLDDHELIKIKVAEDDREIFRTMVDTVVDEMDASLIGSLGRTAIIYRQNPEKNRYKI